VVIRRVLETTIRAKPTPFTKLVRLRALKICKCLGGSSPRQQLPNRRWPQLSAFRCRNYQRAAPAQRAPALTQGAERIVEVLDDVTHQNQVE
jgi:hypothetical protein